MNHFLFLLPLLCVSPLFGDPVRLHTSVRFNGTSTLHDFEGVAEALPAEADWRPVGEGGVLHAERITFEVKALTTDHRKRDRNMMKMFEPDDFPRIMGSVNHWTLGGDGVDTPRMLELRIHGRTVEVPVTIDGFELDADGARLSCHFNLSLNACDLKRPSVLGVIRVGDEVTVHVQARILTGEAPAE